MKSAEKVISGRSGKTRMPSVKYTTLGHFRIEKVSESPPVTVINQPQGYADYWRDVITSSPYYHRDKEHLVVVAVDTRLATKGWHLVSLGSLDGTNTRDSAPCFAECCLWFYFDAQSPVRRF